MASYQIVKQETVSPLPETSISSERANEESEKIANVDGNENAADADAKSAEAAAVSVAATTSKQHVVPTLGSQIDVVNGDMTHQNTESSVMVAQPCLSTETETPTAGNELLENECDCDSSPCDCDCTLNNLSQILQSHHICFRNYLLSSSDEEIYCLPTILEETEQELNCDM